MGGIPYSTRLHFLSITINMHSILTAICLLGIVALASAFQRSIRDNSDNNSQTSFGNFYNYWLTDGAMTFDLTRGNLTGSRTLSASTANITISPSRSAMVIIDMQSKRHDT